MFGKRLWEEPIRIGLFFFLKEKVGCPPEVINVDEDSGMSK
jgi:hypothetical protein